MNNDHEKARIRIKEAQDQAMEITGKLGRDQTMALEGKHERALEMASACMAAS